jgi:poly(A) polymerase
MNLPPEIREILNRIKLALPKYPPIYLVGGAVRDFLLQRPVHDLDFVLGGDVFKIARRVANFFDASFYLMDEEHATARVILKDLQGERLFLDFNALRGSEIEDDLRARDFTVNSIALNLENESLLDPLHGIIDLKDKYLRICSDNAIQDDPLRILRGVRLSLGLNLKMTQQTRTAMKEAVTGLCRVSPERLRDELFRIFEGTHPESAVRILDHLKVLDYVLPELNGLKGINQSPPHVTDVWNHSLACVENINRILSVLAKEFTPTVSVDFTLGYVSGMLGRYRGEFHKHFSKRLNPDRSGQSLLIISALYHDIAKPQQRSVDIEGQIRFFNHDKVGAQITRQRGENLRLSNLEIDRIQLIIRNHMRPLLLANDLTQPTARSTYRFFKDTGEAGVDICLLALADCIAIYQHSLPQDKWIRQVELVRKLLEAWWEGPQEKVKPQPLINGNEIMLEFGLQQGPLIGRLIDVLCEAQVEGIINDRDSAKRFIQQFLVDNKMN